MSAGAVATSYVRVRADTSGFQRDAEGKIKVAGANLGKVFAFAFGAGLGVDLAQKTVNAAIAQQQAISQTRQIVKAAGGDWTVYGKSLRENFVQLADASGFTVEDLAQGFNRLEPSIKNSAKALDTLTSATEIARGRGQDLTVVSTALAKVQAGQTTGLARLGVTVKAYSAEQDAIKQKLLEVQHAEQALAESKAKHYTGTIHLTAAERELSRQTAAQRQELVNSLNAQLDSAKAADKQTTAQRALTELTARYKGQNPIFAASAQGQIARFHESVNELEVTIGQNLLPTLSTGAETARKWIQQLSRSGDVATTVKGTLHDVAGGAQAIATAFRTAEPVLRTTVSLLEQVGPGPILATLAAYKALTLGIGGFGSAQSAVAALNLRGARAAGFAGAEAKLAAKEFGGFRLAASGAATALTGPAGMLGAAALLAGGLYYLSQRESDAEKAANDLTSAFERQRTAAQNAAQARQDAQTITNAQPGLRDERARALEAITKAQERYDVLAGSGRATRAELAQATNNLSIAEAHYRDVNHQVVQSEADKVTALGRGKQAARDTVKAQRDAVTDAQAVLRISEGQARAFAQGSATRLQSNFVKLAFANLTQEADDQSKKLTDKQRERIRALADYIKTIGRQPTQVEIDLILNTKQLESQLAGFKGSLFDLPNVLGDPAALAARGSHAATIIAKGASGALKKDTSAGKAFTTAFVQHIDASTIASAFHDAITQAQAQLVSETGTLASTIGQALDARLKAETLPATREIARLQAEIAATQASSSARDSAQAIADAQKKLGDLQRIFGSGALTADQAQQIAQARVALLDAQDTAANDARQARAAELQGGIDTATKANDAAKAAAQRRLDDLTAQLNDGLITQATYVKRLNALLAKEGVNYKSTGRLLGLAVADGFRDGLASILAQAAQLGNVGQRTLRQSPRGTKAINPNKAEADAIQAFIDSVASSGGRFSVTGAGGLPPGVSLADLISRAGSQRSADTYKTPTAQKQDKGLDYAGRTADHTAELVREVKKLNAKPPVVVHVDGRKSKRKTAEATRS